MDLLGTNRVSSYPQRADEDADYLVVLDIQRFDSALGGSATIEALWSVNKRRWDAVAVIQCSSSIEA